jgi:CubicO group peptidase (beta-lactamase class C family)
MSGRPPKTAAELGLMAGPPPFPPERLVTLANWQDPPWNRWSFQHVGELIPTARIARGNGKAWVLPQAERDLDALTLPLGGRRVPLQRWLQRTYTDGFLVMHRGKVVTERYDNGMAPGTTHLLQSVSKSITGVVCGVLVGRGVLAPGDLVTAHVPELAGTSWNGCTVRHLLDMRAGTRFNEEYDDLHADVRVFEQVAQWRPRTNRRLPEHLTAYYPALHNQGAHGGPFDYRSVLTDVLGWVMERASGSRFAELVSRELWRPMGAEFDAQVTVDSHGSVLADGGVCVALRDLARFGQVLANDGRRGRTQVVPREWIVDTLTPAQDSIEAFADTADRFDRRHGAYYRNQFWVVDPIEGIFMGSGIYGQSVFVHGAAEVVIAKLSTWPVAWEERIARDTRRAFIAIAERLAGG